MVLPHARLAEDARAGRGETGVDNADGRAGLRELGAWILGRNMFGPVRGPVAGRELEGLVGRRAAVSLPVFVLTHHARTPLEMKGGTEFHFVTEGIQAALEQAKAAAGGSDVRIGGGVSTVRQYLQARLIDELHLAVRPVLLGEGENLWRGIDLRALGYDVAKCVQGERAMHVFLSRGK